MNRYEIQLRLTPEQCLDYYRGAFRDVWTRCTDGRSIQFPARLLHRFITMDGVSGTFELTCDANNKCLELRRSAHAG